MYSVFILMESFLRSALYIYVYHTAFSAYKNFSPFSFLSAQILLQHGPFLLPQSPPLSLSLSLSIDPVSGGRYKVIFCHSGRPTPSSLPLYF